ncbi:MAG: class I SAM-dependent methyltransferase [Bryobacteraceae bacterium]
MRDYYNTTYRVNEDGVYNPAPNAFLVQVVRNLRPGRALDVGMGQGRNTIYLAQQGWKVVGLDISDEGIRQAKNQARKLNLNIETVNSRIENFDFGQEQWDLILFCYLDPRPYAQKALAALRPGGAIIVEGFHKRSSKSRLMAGWFEDNELLKLFPLLRVLHYEDVLAKQDWGFQMIEPNRLVRFAAVRSVPEPPGCRWEGKAYKEGESVCWGPQQWRCDPNGWARTGDCPK